MTAFMGMRGTGDWVTNQAPQNWREGILFLDPNGQAPLTAMLSMMGSESTDDPTFHWWTKILQTQGGAVTAVYTDAILNTLYAAATNSAAGVVVYAKCAAAVAAHFRVGHQALLRNSANDKDDTSAKVVSVTSSGANSSIGCKLLDGAGTAGTGKTNDLDKCNTILVVGNINPEGGTIPDALGYDPTEYSNNTQIFRTPLDITRTARLTKLRTGDAYAELKRESLQYHSIEIEKATFFGLKTSGTGSNGKPEKTTQGIIRFVKENSSTSNVDNFSTNATYAGKTWLQSGETWFDTTLEQVFRYGSNEKMAFAGSGAILGINNLAKANAQIRLEPGAESYGLSIQTWITPFGTLKIKTHPLFSYETTNRNMIVILEPKNMKYRYVTDTTFKKDDSQGKAGPIGIDGTKEEYLTECGYEFHHPETFGVLTGVGVDSVV